MLKEIQRRDIIIKMYSVSIYHLEKTKDNRPKLVVTDKIEGLSEDSFFTEDTAEIMGTLLCDQYVESVYIVCYDPRRRIKGIAQVSLGDIDTSCVYKRIISTYVVLMGAYSFELYHNHPDGQLFGSKDDYESYTSLVLLGDIIGVHFDDSIIITSEGWYSIKNKESGVFLWTED